MIRAGGLAADNQINLLMLIHEHIHNNARSQIRRLLTALVLATVPGASVGTAGSLTAFLMLRSLCPRPANQLGRGLYLVEGRQPSFLKRLSLCLAALVVSSINLLLWTCKYQERFRGNALSRTHFLSPRWARTPLSY